MLAMKRAAQAQLSRLEGQNGGRLLACALGPEAGGVLPDKG